MMGQLVGQMTLIQNLAQGQEELKVLVNQLNQNGCNRMKQTIKILDQVTFQPPMRQGACVVESRSFQIATVSQVQQQPRQQQQGNHRKEVAPKDNLSRLACR